MKESLRLNRFLAQAGVASRRRCDDLIRQGRVTINGRIVSELGVRVDPSSDQVVVDGAPVERPIGRWTLALNKPRDVLVAAVDSRGRSTVTDLLGDFAGRVFPVGRLDYRSEGLLLFTNDGELAYRLAHPRFKVEKVYRVEVSGLVSPSLIEAFRRGVVLEDGRTQPARLAIVSRGKERSILEVELREGKKRQVRRMLARFDHEVVKLCRTRFGPVDLGNLRTGKWRELTPAEVERLHQAVGLSSPSGSAPA